MKTRDGRLCDHELRKQPTETPDARRQPPETENQNQVRGTVC